VSTAIAILALEAVSGTLFHRRLAQELVYLSDLASVSALEAVSATPLGQWIAQGLTPERAHLSLRVSNLASVTFARMSILS
jgi:hypothetical protein